LIDARFRHYISYVACLRYNLIKILLCILNFNVWLNLIIIWFWWTDWIVYWWCNTVMIFWLIFINWSNYILLMTWNRCNLILRLQWICLSASLPFLVYSSLINIIHSMQIRFLVSHILFQYSWLRSFYTADVHVILSLDIFKLFVDINLAPRNILYF
jgi:hypothetical protein